ncbi:MAG: hypothetical protein IJ408_03685 [Clostridia bacterium]|nr:hypothetical protein [Clostridia bacterium]
MKRIITLILVLCLLLSVCGCKREDPEDTAAPFNLTDEKEQARKTEETVAVKNEGNENNMKNLQLDPVYSEYEILVTLTESESSAEKNYTVVDFSNINISYVYKLGNYTDYFFESPEIAEKYKNKTTLVLYLKEGGSENILSAIKELEKDSRVFFAEPCALELGKGYNGEIEVFAKTQYEVPEWFIHNFLKDLENPPEYSLSFSTHIVEGSKSVHINVANDNVCDVISIVNHLHEKNRKIKIKFKYKFSGDSLILCLTEAQSNLQTDYSSKDFESLQLLDVQKIHTSISNGKKRIFLRLKPEHTDPFFMKKYEQILAEDMRVEYAFAASEEFCESLDDIKKYGYDSASDEKSKTSSVTADENMSDDLIIVYIKKGYSAIHQKYTPDDFPYLELNCVKTVFEYTQDNRVGLFLTLKHKGKQAVVSAVEKLKQDERVYLACPDCFYELTY